MKRAKHKTEGIIYAISISKERGTKKINVQRAILKVNFGIIGDAHAGGERQVSLLAEESVGKMRRKGLKVEAGDFAENITTKGIDLLTTEIGDKLKAGERAVLEITQLGKICRARCSIYYRAGDCVMPKEGVFARVLKGGIIRPGDKLEVIKSAQRTK